MKYLGEVSARLMLHPGPRHPDSHDITVLLAPFVDELVDLHDNGLKGVEDAYLKRS